MLNQFSRTELLIGQEALHTLARSTVAVFGIGGVGSYAVEGLARAGVGRLVLIDHDCICLTNLNRQIHATHRTIGLPKVEVMRDRILDINPAARIETVQAFFSVENADRLVNTDYNYIIDAIDTVGSKIELIVRAGQKGIPIISCMGAGNKLDPARLETTDIYATSVCPLAKVMRRELRKRGVESLPVVYSREEPVKPGHGRESGGPDISCSQETARLEIKCRQVPGSISFVPSVAGLIMAGYVVRDLIKGI